MGRPGKTIPVWGRELVVELSFGQGKKNKQIYEDLGRKVSLSSIKRFVRSAREKGHVNPLPRPGRMSGFNLQEWKFVRDYVDQHVDVYLDELAEEIGNRFGHYVSEKTVWKLLDKMNYTRKKLKRIAHKRSEQERADYAQRMQDRGYRRGQLLFVDETGTKKRDYERNMGRALRCVIPFRCWGWGAGT
jgi:transposase